MAFDYITSGPPIIPAPTQPSLLFDKTNDVVYVSTMPSLMNAPAWVAVGGSGGLSVNGVLVGSPDLDNSSPAPPGGKTNITWQTNGSQISGWVPSAAPAGSTKQLQFNNAGAFGASSELLWDIDNTISALHTLNIGNSTSAAQTNCRVLVNDQFTTDIVGSYGGIYSVQSFNLTGDQSAKQFASMATTTSFFGDATYGGIFSFDLNTLYAGTGPSTAVYGFYAAMNVNPGSPTSALIPFYAGAANAGDCAQINGLFSGVQHSVGTAVEAAGVRISLDISGNVTALYGVKIDTLGLSTGVVSSYKGIYVGDVTTIGAGTNTAPWSIYSDGGKSFFKDQIVFGATVGSFLKSGSGTPEASLTAPIGSMWLRTDGGLSNSLYFKESGAGNTGWKAGVVGSTDELSALSSYLTTDAGIAAAQNAICVINRTNPGVNTKRKGLNVYLETAANQAGANNDGLQVNVGVTIDATTITGANHVDGIESSTWVTGTAVSLAQINAVKARIGVVGNAHVQNAVSFLAYLPNVTTGATVDNLTGLELDTPAGGGTVTNITGVNASLNTNGVIGVVQSFGIIAGGGTNGASRAAVLLDSSNSGVVGSALAWGSPAAITNAIYSGTGSPETVVTANKGSLFLRQDGGAGTTLYVKESGSGNTGWVGK